MLGNGMKSDTASAGETSVFIVRVLTAIAQATALYLLVEAAVAPLSWPTTDPRIFRPLFLASAYVPMILMLGLGQIRARPLAIWASVAAVIILGLGYHDAARAQFVAAGWSPGIWFWYRLGFALPVALFVAHALVVDAIIERRLLPPYPRHFDTAWKQGVQIVLASVFVGVFWGVLWLGAGLFKLVDIDVFRRLIEHRWFAIPATTLALAISLHVTDVQPALIRGARSLALTLFSWLLPLLAAILLGFLGSLPFVSLAPLWKIHFATTLLLTAAGLLIFLINCCYQDGAAEKATSRIKRLAGTVASLELVPLVGLAIWALALRVGQYGWSVERILAAAVILVASCYAVGYAAAAVRSPVWLKRIEITNVATALVVVALVLALCSPIADPARLMVADQVARLKSGTVPPEKFDFVALKFDGARWGAAALTKLSEAADGPDAAVIRRKAAQALAMTNRYGAGRQDLTKPSAETLADRVTVYPAGRSLPDGLFDAELGRVEGNWQPVCLRTGAKCIARFISLHPGDAEAILFLDIGTGSIFEQDGQGRWRKTGNLSGPMFCNPVHQGLEHGDFGVEPHTWPDLLVGGQRVQISPWPPQTCPPAASKPPAPSTP